MTHTRLAIVFALVTSFAARAAMEGPYTYTVTNGQATITDFSTSYSGILSITNNLGGFPVTEIGGWAFDQCKSLTYVSMPDSVTNIGQFAFQSCSSLTDIIISKGVIGIDHYAFWNCSGLLNYTVATNNNTYGSIDGVLVNKSRTTLLMFPKGRIGSYVIPGSITSVGRSAFINSALNSVTIPVTVTNLDATAFKGSKLTSVTIPSNVVSIGELAFCNCLSLVSVTILNGVATIGGDAFSSNPKLTDSVIPDSVTNIGYGAFANCPSMTNLTVTANNMSFSSVNGVLFNKEQTVLIQCPAGKTGAYLVPTGVAMIGGGSFSFCRNLISVTIPNSVTNVGGAAFEYCGSLRRFYACGNAPTYSASTFFGDSYPTVYYLPSTTNWTSTFAGRPTKLWNPVFSDMTLTAGTISCTVTGTPTIPLAVEIRTNLLMGSWIRLQTTNINSFGSFDFHDLNFSNYPARFYRIIGP